MLVLRSHTFSLQSQLDMSSSASKAPGARDSSGGQAQQGAAGGQEKRKKESILEMSKFLEKSVRIKFAGGRECSGILKGYDPLLNVVLDNTVEYLRDPDDPYRLTEDTRHLGLVVCRGTAVVLVCPLDGMEAIPNPFVQE